MSPLRPTRHTANFKAFDFLYTVKLPPGVSYDEFVTDVTALYEAQNISYAAFQLERGERHGFVHVQLFVQFPERQRPGRLKSLLCAERSKYRTIQPHYEKRRGTPEEARDYCIKEDTRCGGSYTLGDLQPDREGQGTRTDVSVVTQAVLRQESMRVIAQTYPDHFVRLHRGLYALREVTYDCPSLDFTPPVLCLWGASNLGKTRFARLLGGSGLYRVSLPSTRDFLRWPAYDPATHHTIWIDDIDKFPHLSEGEILAILDEVPFPARGYGSGTYIRPKAVIITANKEPKGWFGGKFRHDHDVMDPLYRRLTPIPGAFGLTECDGRHFYSYEYGVNPVTSRREVEEIREWAHRNYPHIWGPAPADLTTLLGRAPHAQQVPDSTTADQDSVGSAPSASSPLTYSPLFAADDVEYGPSTYEENEFEEWLDGYDPELDPMETDIDWNDFADQVFADIPPTQNDDTAADDMADLL